MTRIRSRRSISASACAVLIVGLSACGSETKTSAPTTIAPKVIIVGADAGNGEATAAGAPSVANAPAGTKMMVRNVTYTYSGAAADLTAPAASWFFAPGAEPTPEQISTLAKLLGVPGQAQKLTPEQGGGWLVGPQDYSGATLAISGDAMLSWYYNPAPGVTGVATSCAGVAEPGVVTPGTDSAATVTQATDVPAGDVPATDVPAGDVPATDVPPGKVPACEQPQPPANVPTSEQAKAKATEFFRAQGLDLGSYELDAYADQWSANVTAYLELDGTRTNVSTSVGYGADGAVTWAGGFLATAQRGGDYPRIGIQAAVQRLNDQSSLWLRGGPGGLPMGAAQSGAAAGSSGSTQAVPLPAPADSTATANTATANTGVVATGGAATNTGVVTTGGPTVVGPPQQCDVAADCAPVDASVTVNLTNAKPSLEQVWAQDGTIWLMPGYSFDGSDGGTYSVIAVEDKFIQTNPEPSPSEPSTVGTAPTATPASAPVPSIAVEPGQVPASPPATVAATPRDTTVTSTG